MKSKSCFKMCTTPQTKSKLILLFVLLLSFCVLVGGCGGDDDDPATPSSNTVSPDVPAPVGPEEVDVNAMWNGAWVCSSGIASADFGGRNLALSVKNVAAYFENSNVSNDEGSAKFSALFHMTARDDMLQFPLLVDNETMTTERVSDEEWDVSTDKGTFTIKFSSDKEVSFEGTFDLNGAKVDCNLILTKVEASELDDVDTLLNGTWTTVSLDKNGGFIAQAGGFYLGTKGYINAIFSGSDIDNSKAHLTADAFINTISMDLATPGVTTPVILSNDVRLTKIFGKIYRVDIAEDNTKGVIMFTGEDTATFIVMKSSEAHVTNALFQVKKMPAADNISEMVTSIINSTWKASTAAGVLQSADIQLPLVMSADVPFQTRFSGIDTVNFTLTASADGVFDIPVANISINVGDLLKIMNAGNERLTLKINHIGYNTLYSVSDHGSIFTVILQDSSNGYIVAEINPSTTQKCVVLGVMKKD